MEGKSTAIPEFKSSCNCPAEEKSLQCSNLQCGRSCLSGLNRPAFVKQRLAALTPWLLAVWVPRPYVLLILFPCLQMSVATTVSTPLHLCQLGHPVLTAFAKSGRMPAARPC